MSKAVPSVKREDGSAAVMGLSVMDVRGRVCAGSEGGVFGPEELSSYVLD